MTSQANRYEQILARRAEGISQNLHAALDKHKQLVADDVTSALVEHVRSSIMYERQHLRELEALRTDISNAASKAIQTKPAVVPRPSVIPKLEDDSKPPVPRPASAAAATATIISGTRSAFVHSTTSIPSSPITASHRGSVSGLPPTSPASTAPSSAGLPPSTQSPLPPQSPGAGPSSPAPHRSAAFTPPLMDGPPLGGRFVDGTKSMFVKNTPSPLVPSASSTFSPQTPAKSAGFPSPLHAPATATTPTTIGAANPLAQSMSAAHIQSSALYSNGQPELDPLGLAKPHQMSASMRVQPTRPRLDAREAASKLANMF